MLFFDRIFSEGKLIMHILTKFFSQRSFLDMFVSGKLYMNTLNYFWNNGFEEQKDIFEGVVCTVPVKDFKGIPTDFQAVQASDYHFRAEGYKFCNVLCFYKINFTQEGRLLHCELNKSMAQFGEYVAIITNEREFLRRVEAAVRKRNYEVLCGDVHYHPQMLNGRQSKEGPRIYLGMEDQFFEIKELQNRGFNIRKRDCFDKGMEYHDQNEWRVALYRGKQITDAYELNVGNLSDIVLCCPVKDIQKGLDECISRYGVSDVRGWHGTIDRRNMRELFYKLGDNKTRMFSVIG